LMKNILCVLPVILLLISCGNVLAETPAKPELTIRWLGQSCFYIITPDGAKIITDPYNERMPYPAPALEAQLVTVSHNHGDHNAVGRVKGTPLILNTVGSKALGNITVTGYPSFHDNAQGTQRGPNVIFKFQIGSFSLVHLGDLGEIPDPEVVKAISGADVLLAPVGEVYTMPVERLMKLIQECRPRLIVPMHYSVNKEAPVAGLLTVDKFLAALPAGTKVIRADKLSLTKPEPGFQVVVLNLWKPE
jgi:L-ascorbate metabolism protein UlaG (beta-lactamase superfamily)